LLAFGAALLLSLALLLAAAKAHGRQVRLERELEGHREVVFGGDNPPFVEALWRRDRRRFWTVVPLAALAMGAWLWLGDAGRAPLPGLFARDPTFGLSLAALVLWPLTAGFLVAGVRSAAHLRARLRERPDADPAWRREAWRGSVRWWSLVAALALAVAWLSIVA
jgi:hypothetical protein